MQTLNHCKLNEIVQIRSIEECEMKRRLLDLGFVVGASIKPVLESPSRGMRAYIVKGCKIGLRNTVGEHILVEEGEDHAV